MVNGTTAERINWYSVQQAAELHRVHPNTIRARIKSRQIEFRQIERNGQLVYEVAISDADAMLLRDKENCEKMAETIADLRVQLGMAKAALAKSEEENAGLRGIASNLRHQLDDTSKAVATTAGIAKTFRGEYENGQKRIEVQAEEIGHLRAEAKAAHDHSDWVNEQNQRILDLLREARTYYWGPGLWPAIRRRFRTFRGFTRVP